MLKELSAMKKLIFAGTLLSPLLLSFCTTNQAPPSAPELGSSQHQVKPALESFTSGALLEHIRVLASDEFEGRAPASKGEELTVNYLTDQFRKIGLRPGNPDGTYVQKVPLVGFTGQPSARFMVTGKELELKFPGDYVASSPRLVPEVSVKNSDVVFVGYGVVAPEYDWDDYKGVDVKGKTIVMLVNDPPVADPQDPSRLDEKMFRGKAMTYYGRWTYKYEIASKKGAAAAVIIHETVPAGYPYEVVKSSWSGENFDIQKPDKNMGLVAVQSWINLDTAKRLFGMSGLDFDELKRTAVRKDFKPVPLRAKASFLIKNTLREVDSRNVSAKLDGSDPKLKDELVIYTAHWDHLGKDEKLQGDQVFNGAIDNASGVASLLEIARAYTQLRLPPKRSILFLSVTAEEKGLLGAKYYAENPLYPLVKTVAEINMDSMNLWGRTRDVIVVGLGNSTLDDVVKQVATSQNRVVTPDAEPEKGYFYRSDHFEFAKKGVPALHPEMGGIDFVGRAAGYGLQKRDEYTAKDYHKVSDEIKPDWNLGGAIEDVQLLFQVGFRVANTERLPEWKPGTEFKAVREEMLKSAEKH
jgi:Zn-dependent M28 family amino/carboxypeptidase